MNTKNPEADNKNGEATPETDTKENRSDSNIYQRTVTGTGQSTENFDGTRQQGDEKDLEDRDTNDGDANTENN